MRVSASQVKLEREKKLLRTSWREDCAAGCREVNPVVANLHGARRRRPAQVRHRANDARRPQPLGCQGAEGAHAAPGPLQRGAEAGASHCCEAAARHGRHGLNEWRLCQGASARISCSAGRASRQATLWTHPQNVAGCCCCRRRRQRAARCLHRERQGARSCPAGQIRTPGCCLPAQAPRTA